MAEITAAMVKELRDKTGAGMMDCKAALAATDGDLEAAVDWLRKKGLAKAAKKSGRVAAEGLIGVWAEGAKAAMVEVNSETDFVARNDMFQGLVRMIAHVAFKLDSGDIEKIKAASAGSGTIADAIATSVATIGENMTLRRGVTVSVAQGHVATYSHAAVAESLGKIGVLVALESAGKADELAGIGRQIAMHVAAQNPLAIDASGLDAGLIEREKGVLRDKNAGKPPHVLDKIVESGLKTFYKEVCLLEQPFVMDPSKSVAQALKEVEGRVGAPITLKSFVRYALGEGIEREESDFAAEVAAAAGTR